MRSIEVEVDARRRVSLARLGKAVHEADRYRVEMESDGSIRLIPMASVSKRELELLTNPAAMALWNERMRQAEQESAEGRLVDYSAELDAIDFEDDDDSVEMQRDAVAATGLAKAAENMSKARKRASK